MFQLIKRVLLGLGLLALFPLSANAQLGQSPYSTIGVGEINGTGLTHNMGMAGIGVAVPYSLFLNNSNPALLVSNSLTVFEMGMRGESRTSFQGNVRQNSGGGSLFYSALGIPIIPSKWTMSVGVMPYSYVNYNILVSDVVPNSSSNVNYNYRGQGGLNQVYFSNGVRLLKSLSIGVKGTYLFGSTFNETVATLSDTLIASAFRTAYFERQRHGGYLLGAGIFYRKNIAGTTALNLGASYDHSGTLGVRYLSRLERRSLNNDVLASDTLENSIDIYSIDIPNAYVIGFSLDKDFSWMFGGEVRIQDWSQYRNIRGSNENMRNSFRAAIGGEWTPDASSVTSYFKRVTYRAGTSYQNTPFAIQNEQIREFGINFGSTFPLKGYSNLNLSMEVGQRGFTNSAVIKENYFRIFFGLTINDVRWVKRPLYD